MNHACLRRKHAKTFLALSYFNACDHQADHKTTINTTLFDRAFDISVINKFPTSNENYKTALCHVHYDKFNHYINDSSVFKSSNTKRFVNILDENKDLFLKYLASELNYVELKQDVKFTCCSTCYNSFNIFCRSDIGELTRYQTSQYLQDCVLDHFKFSEIPNIDNLFIFQEILEFVVTLHTLVVFIWISSSNN